MQKKTDPHRNRPLPELLAPAGSPEAFRAAVAAGADAIYLSGKRFGARKYAANFSDEEIEEAVRFAHSHGVRVYVTVNTLIHDRELSGVLEYLIWLYATGVDAVLVQDTGIAALARGMIPGLTLHASTQMTIHHAAGVRWAAEQGFSRVVLARELTLEEVSAIAEETKDTGTGLEVFVHGALCYGYSGQCLLSSVIGGRSGNRGMCAQPCRKPWALVTGSTDEYGKPVDLKEVPLRDHYLLSPKDLCTYRHLPELVQSPVTSLKIEGRMKSPEYVTIVVSTYRRALDAIAAGAWEPSEAAERDLILAFNRGFTGGYLSGDRHERLMGRDAPDNRGLLIGRVVRYEKAQSRAAVKMEGHLVPGPGDGLLFTHPEHAGETGFALNTEPVERKGEVLIRVPRPVPAGSAVYLTSSRELDARARQMLAKPAQDLRHPLPVDMTATVNAEGTLQIRGSVERPDGTVVTVSCQPEAKLAPAESQPLTGEMIRRQLEKCGGTPFVLRSLSLTYDNTRFAPIAEINRVRREFFAAAAEQLIASYRPSMAEVRRVQHRWQDEALRYRSRVPGSGTTASTETLRIGICVDTISGIQEAAASGADRIYFEPDLIRHPRACGGRGTILPPRPVLEEAIGICHDAGVSLFWKFPRITHDRYLAEVLPVLRELAPGGLSGCMTDNPGTARAVRALCPGIPVAGYTGLNIFNHAAVIAAAPLFSLVTLSPELSREEIALLGSYVMSRPAATECALVVQGSGDAMITEDCVKRIRTTCSEEDRMGDSSRQFTGIRDETGQVFPLYTGDGCRTRIQNAQELCLIEYLPAIRSAGIREIIIDARNRPPRYTRAMCRAYRKAVAQSSSGSPATYRNAMPKSQVNEIEQISLGGSTTGHFLRGLKE